MLGLIDINSKRGLININGQSCWKDGEKLVLIDINSKRL